MRLSRLTLLVLALVAAFVALLLYGPIAVAVFFSLFRLRQNTVDWNSFSFDAYGQLLKNGAVLEALATTLLVGASAVALALVFGTLLAFEYRRRRSPWREILQALVFLPFVMPPIITGLSLLVFFRETDVPRSLATVVVGHTVFVIAVVYRIVLNRLEQLKASLTEASLDLGASAFQTFRYVLMPNLLPAFAASAILSFALSFDETLITLLVTGTKSTLPMWLWSMMRLGFKPDINALVTLILLFSVALAAVAIWATRRARP
jgi:putative spermidine/putrescine transport system permease protein/spermidine/putrescine transport system permease protein